MSADSLYSGALALLGAACGFAVAWRRRRVSRRRREEERLDSLIHGLKLLPAEKTLLDEVTVLSGEPMERVTRLVLSFDRGVDRYLSRLASELPEARASRLRRLKSLRQKLGFDSVPAGVPLLSSREIPSRQEVYVRFAAGHAVHSGILDEQDDSGLLIRFAEPPVTSPSSAHAEAEVYFLRRNEGGYRFPSRVLAAIEPELLRFAHPERLWREQRRSYFRAPTEERILLARLPDGEAPSLCAAMADVSFDTPGTVTELSAGGLRLVAAGAGLKLGAALALQLPFLESPPGEVPSPLGPSEGTVLPGTIVKVYREDAEFGIAFGKTSEAARAALARYVESAGQRTLVTQDSPTLP